jgi:hypothetical protein
MTSMDTPQQKKAHKGGGIVRTEPYDMQLFVVEPLIREVFQRVGCFNFCQKMQRGHPEVAREFSLNFDGTKTKVGTLELEVSEETIEATTEIPNTGERWFKAMNLNATFSKEFLKPECQGDNLSKGVPRSHMIEGFDKMLRVIQRYFTCEGRFNMIYQYHIRLLLHFTGKDLMNLPFYLFRSIGKMADRVQAKSKAVDTSVFHSGLIKMLVMEELKKKNIDWEQFIASAHFQLNVAPTPQSKVQSPLQADNIVHTETSKKRKRKDIVKNDEAPKEQEEEEGSHYSPQREFSPKPAPESAETPSTRATGTKGRRLLFPSPVVAVEARVRRPFTRSSTKKESVEKEDIVEAPIKRKGKGKVEVVEKHIEVIDITTPPENPTFKRLNRQLKEARKEIANLKGEGLAERKKLKDLMDMYLETIDKARFTAKRFLPLHRQLKNLYRQNRDLQAQIRRLKLELQPFKEELAQRNLNMLAQAATRRSSRLRK